MLQECELVAYGDISVSLPTVLSDLNERLIGFIPLYIELMANSSDYVNNLIYIENGPFDPISYDIDVSITLLIESYQAITSDFQTQMNTQNQQKTTLVTVSLVVTVIWGILTWIFVIRNLSKREFEGRELLGLVPMKLVFENFELKMYIIKNYLGKNKNHLAKDIIKG